MAKTAERTELTRQVQATTGKPRPLFASLAILSLLLLLHLIAVTHTAYPSTAIRTCSEAIRYYDYQDKVPVASKQQTLQDVQLISEVTAGQPSALVTVLEGDASSSISVYVYGCTLQHQQPHVEILFKRQHLLQGSVTATRANTLSISTLDTKSLPELRTPSQTLQQNIYREYAWKNGQFIQVSFPGLYPVTSRTEAEELQEQFDSGQPLSWADPLITTSRMAQELFHWDKNNMQVTMQNVDGITAHALLVQNVPHTEVMVTLQRLIQHDSSGLWFVTQAQSNNLTLDTSPATSLAISPLPLTVGSPFNGGTITIALLNHALRPVPISFRIKPVFNAQAIGTVSGTLSFTAIAPDQPGLLLLTRLAPDKQVGQLLLRNFILD
jgi:hypothetical protein